MYKKKYFGHFIKRWSFCLICCFIYDYYNSKNIFKVMINVSERNMFLQKSNEVLSEIYDKFQKIKSVNLNDFDCNKTVLIIIDMVNGFAKGGALSSKRILSINGRIAALSDSCSKLGIEKIAFADSHSENSPEFKVYPKHCVRGDWESLLTDEIIKSGKCVLIEKNSTNGFIESRFLEWLEKNEDIDNFIIVGNCTDICVQQFSLSLKAYYNMKNREKNIIVVKDLVETYDQDFHYSELMSLISLYNMNINGIDIVSTITF